MFTRGLTIQISGTSYMATDQNPLLYPLSRILGGGEIPIRILRLLFASQNEKWNPYRISKKIKSSDTGVRKALALLEDTGILLCSGSSSLLYEANFRHPLYSSLFHVFEVERGYALGLVSRIKGGIQDLTGLESVWLGKNILSDSYSDDSPLPLFVYVRSSVIENIRAAIRKSLSPVELDYNISISVRIITDADISIMDSNEILSHFESDGIMGSSPAFILSEKIDPLDPNFSNLFSIKRSHDEIDQENLDFGKKIAKKIRADRSLIDQALKIARENEKNSIPSMQTEFSKWINVLESRSIKRITNVLTSDDEESRRMRQSSPFKRLYEK